MIVAGPAGFMKAHYRTFNIADETITPGDDYAMMREVLSRRFARLAKEAEREEDSESFPLKPDLVLIDGGRGQFDVAREALSASGVDGVTIVGVAKGADRNAGRETFFMEGREPFRLPPHDPALYFVQRLRNEAHRFAIGRIEPDGKRPLRKTHSTKSPASARHASGLSCWRSVPPRLSLAPRFPILKKCRASTRRPRGLCSNIFSAATSRFTPRRMNVRRWAASSSSWCANSSSSRSCRDRRPGAIQRRADKAHADSVALAGLFYRRDGIIGHLIAAIGEAHRAA